MKLILSTIFTLFTITILFSQIGGNQVYKNRNNINRFDKSISNFSSTDSTVTINVNILLNQTADKYILTLGVNQNGKNPKECLAQINKRIDSFITNSKKIGIKKEDIYVDFITQTKIFDFEVKSNNVEQIENGFEIKKNIIIKVDKYENIEKLISEASVYQIYDVIKVDYLNDNTELIYENLLNEAKLILDKKKQNYFKIFNRKLIGQPRANDNFYYLFPKSQYQEYSAYESSELDNYPSSIIKKIARKNKTFYFEGIDYSGFDKVINNSNPTVAIQYILNLTVVYDIEKNL
ncbi:MAG TPA: hypothetical protein DEQ26_10185 [Flavobacteriaceae bacterium]|nr:hypothetical protein [Flavobacteriaceae bacterium]